MKNGKKKESRPGKRLIFTPYIVRNGKRVYPKKARCFAFWVDL